MRKQIGILLVLISIFFIGVDIYKGAIGSYRYNKEYECYWNLADKASTISKKAEGIDKFVSALENSGFQGKYNAIFLQTPDNSFDYNFEALKSLQLRMHEIEKMDVTSFQYQTAIQQITEQEQGQAREMLSEFKGIWWKEYHPLLWNWICFIQVVLLLGLLITGEIIWINSLTIKS
jgi:hypothetical protein